MSFDYSKLSDADLEAFSKEDYTAMSDEGLQHISSYEPPRQTAPKEQPYDSRQNYLKAGEELGTFAVGAGQLAMENPGATAALASSPVTVPYGMKLANKVADVAGGYTNAKNSSAVAQLAHQVRMSGGSVDPSMVNRVLEQTANKVAPVTTQAVTPQGVAPGAAPAPASMTSKVFGGLAKAAAPLAIGSELFYTGPEERRALQEMEASGTSLSDQANKLFNTDIFGRGKKKKDDTYNGLTSHEQELLHKDHTRRADRLKNMIQEAAAKKALVDPTMAR
jgi:hypothetical protein